MTAPLVSDDLIRRQAWGSSYERGVTYFRAGAVRSLDWDEAHRTLTSEVQGGEPGAYRCLVRFARAGDPRPIVSATCTCHVEEDCKHVVATLLASNAAVSERANAAGAPSWRALLPADPIDDAGEFALGIELREREGYDPGNWHPRRVEPVTPRSLARGASDLHLAMRPLRRGARGAWVRRDVSWDALRRATPRPRAAAWFTELYALAHPSSTSGGLGAVPEWLTLDTAASSHLWAHLEAAQGLGIPLVATRPSQSVALAREGEVAIALAPAAGGALRLSARVRVDGEPVDAAGVRPIGASGLYLVEPVGDRVAVTLAPAALPEPVLALLRRAEGLEVPATEAAEFLREAYPRLARRVTVIAQDGLVLPAPSPPRLRVAAAFGDDRVSHTLTWDYPGLPAFAYPAAAHPDRDAAAESALRTSVESAWTEASDLPFTPVGEHRDADAAEFAVRVLAAIERLDDVRVEVSGIRPRYRELRGAPEVSVSTVETPDSDWFDLGVLVTVEGRTIPLAPLLTALTRGRARMKLADGAYFSLAHPSLARLRELLEEAAALDEWQTGPRLSRYQTALWAEFEDLADEAEPAVAWRELAAGLRDVDRVAPVPLPKALHAELRSYQREGFHWLAFLWRHGLGGILADDMGLGKTLQTLALFAHARETGERGPFLVVAPTSVLATWRAEAARFTPGLVVREVAATRSKTRESVADAARSADVIVTSYAVLRLDESEFAGVEWAGVVFDEAQFLKNPQTKLHQAAKRLRARSTFAITGTPLENSLTDLWALFSLTAPGLFPSARRFRDEYVAPIEKGRVPDNVEGGPYRAARLERLRRRIRPLLLRRTKELVAPDLPPKQEQDLHVELSPAHRALYDTVLQRERQKVLGLLDDLDRNRFIVFRSLTLLRLLSLAPVLVDERHADLGSSKLDALLAHLAELAAEGHRALVFSQFTSFLTLVGERLGAAGIAYASLDGSTRRRAEVVEGFRGGDAPVFLISLKAGGFGLTLTEADYVFVLDPWWNPAAEEQAIDRTHRLGQQRSVFVYRLLAADTIEEKVRELQQRKARLFQSVVDDEDLFARSLTAEDIRGLLGD